MESFISTAYAAEDSIHIALKPFIVGDFLGVPITATMITAWLTMLLLVVATFFIGRNLRMVPNKLQSISEMLIGGVYDYVKDVLGSRDLANRYFPIIMTIFVFVLSLNWLGLLPGVAAVGLYDSAGELTPVLYPSATDINITIAFAIVAFLTIQLAGVLALGVFKYTGKFINFKSPFGFIMGIIDLISELTRLISFSFRLFGNVFAGKTLLVVVIFFVPYFLPVPMYAFEVLFGFVQAFIFAILTLFFIKLAITESSH